MVNRVMFGLLFLIALGHPSFAITDQLMPNELSKTTMALNAIPTQSLNEYLEKSAGGYPFGIDISQWQMDLMQHFEDRGFSFIICKATEGTDKIDPRFRENWKHIKQRDLVRGAYHFYLADGTPLAQADHYLDTLNDWRLFWHDGKPSAYLPPIVDIEGRGVSKNVDIPTLQRDFLTFLEYIEFKTHRKPMIYTGVWFANKYLDNPKFGDYPLWVANYTQDSVPTLPKAWQNRSAKFWQKSHRYVLNSRWTDFNVFFGNLDELRRGLVEDKSKVIDSSSGVASGVE